MQRTPLIATFLVLSVGLLTACSDSSPSATLPSPVAALSMESIAPDARVVSENDLKTLDVGENVKILRSHTFSDGKVFKYVEYQGNVIDGDAVLGSVVNLEAQFASYEADLKSIKSQGAMTNRCVGGIYFGACVGNWEGVRWPKPNGQSWTPVYYETITGFSPSGKQAILDAMLSIQNAIGWNVQFFESNTATNRIYFTQDASSNTGGCWSKLGMQGGRQPLNLQPPNSNSTCQTKGIAIHELLHALGMMHEHSRPDRDNYITINTSNLTSEGTQQIAFEYWQRDMAEYTPFDFSSIMLYSNKIYDPYHKFTYNDALPIYTVNVNLPSGIVLGQRDGLSTSDIATLNMRYK